MDGSAFRDGFRVMFIMAVLAVVCAFGLGYGCAHFPLRLHVSVTRDQAGGRP